MSDTHSRAMANPSSREARLHSGGRSGVAHAIADFVIASSWQQLPAPVQMETVRAHLNWMGCAVGGATTDTADAAIRGIGDMGNAGHSPVLGRRERFDLANAALLNCLNSAAHAFDDTHLQTITHPTGPVAAAAWATVHARCTQGKSASGEELLLAIMLGIEIECRLSNTIIAAGADLGWYMTGISGGVGAAVAAGRLLALDHDRLVAAIGLAAAQACGVRATHGSMATAYVPAVACRNGLTAAWMASAGFTCADGVIDGRNGLLQVMTAHADAGTLDAGLGTRFELLNNAYKPYPCGIVIHPAIDAALALAANPHVESAMIERVDLRVHPDALSLTWRKLPNTILDAQVSLYHWVAAALTHGRAGIEQSELPCVADPRVRSLQEKIFPVADASLAGDQAAARVQLRDGRFVEVRIEHATGSAANPMTNEHLASKFCSLAGRALGEARARRLLEACWSLPGASNAAELLAIGTL